MNFLIISQSSAKIRLSFRLSGDRASGDPRRLGFIASRSSAVFRWIAKGDRDAHLSAQPVSSPVRISAWSGAYERVNSHGAETPCITVVPGGTRNRCNRGSRKRGRPGGGHQAPEIPAQEIEERCRRRRLRCWRLQSAFLRSSCLSCHLQFRSQFIAIWPYNLSFGFDDLASRKPEISKSLNRRREKSSRRIIHITWLEMNRESLQLKKFVAPRIPKI